MTQSEMFSVDPFEMAFIGIGIQQGLDELKQELHRLMVKYHPGGMIELVHECVGFCMNQLSKVPDNIELDGVFAYEVIEPLAKWAVTTRLQSDAPLRDSDGYAKLLDLLADVASVPVIECTMDPAGQLTFLKASKWPEGVPPPRIVVRDVLRHPIGELTPGNCHDLEKVKSWFQKMTETGLLFHPDDDPATVIASANDERTFTDAEARHLSTLMPLLFKSHGDVIHEVAARCIGVA
ncbi:hypothetical protein [Denitratimonas sp. CY0512]|uniref:hypothetical protein n=1 Tax=Denitratimonas sp. CY0512 TaxID=3131940 RepID=UPI0030A2B92D